MIRPHYVPLYQSICQSKKMAALPDDTCRMFFTWLEAWLDSWGRSESEAGTLNARVWPRLRKSDEETERVIQECAKAGLIVLYEHDGKRLLQDPVWERFAGKVGKKERRGESEFPPPPTDCRTTPVNGQTTECRTSPVSRARAGAHLGLDISKARLFSGSEEEGDTGEKDPEPPPKRAKAEGDHPACIQHWEAEWTRTRLGTKATVEAREGAAVAWMLKHADPPEVRRRMTAMLEDADPWIAQNASLSILRSKWDRFAVSIRPNREPTGLDAARSLIAKQRAKANGTTGP